MPEGPTVRRYCSLALPFVGQLVTKVGGSTKQISLQDLMEQQLQDCQVHGKNLYLAFGCSSCSIKKPEKTDDVNTQDDGKTEEGCSLITESSAASKEQSKPGTSEEMLVRKWLRFHFGLYGSIRANELARARRGNKRGDWKDPTPRLIVYFDGGGFLVFYNCRMSWCSCPFVDPSRDILCPEFDKKKALRALSQPRPVCITLMDQSIFSGVGNIIKNEILYLARVHPLSLGSILPQEDLTALIDHAITFTANWLNDKMKRKALRYHIYLKEQCENGHQVVKETIGPLHGLKRLTWYCPTCQKLVRSGDEVQPALE
ncbi:endonuclease 8-like 2 [Pyxicephalus adspersus]|uniref:endonuclease 8-like 2 n=1 Tax=Pyxicephalus adspersus TaxID=30357 RepID=UPI003B5CFAAB